jgi:hypothetical protein
MAALLVIDERDNTQGGVDVDLTMTMLEVVGQELLEGVQEGATRLFGNRWVIPER